MSRASARSHPPTSSIRFPPSERARAGARGWLEPERDTKQESDVRGMQPRDDICARLGRRRRAALYDEHLPSQGSADAVAHRTHVMARRLGFKSSKTRCRWRCGGVKSVDAYTAEYEYEEDDTRRGYTIKVKVKVEWRWRGAPPTSTPRRRPPPARLPPPSTSHLASSFSSKSFHAAPGAFRRSMAPPSLHTLRLPPPAPMLRG
ncbi:hypothetical protein C8R45DRAFT_1218646 [Mycena sanguinolenta]|nr:hypothetical protein C8R45DRAFT_1218646 [Mycena sanguinolenta]